jgi:uncharacterized SAM-binding protein YcdF (DUF218 family)
VKKFLRKLKFLAIALAVLAGMLAIGYWCRVPLFQGAANAWIVNEPLSRSDAIVVLGGGVDTRPFEAAHLFHLGLAPKILLMNPRQSPAVQLGLLPSDSDLSRSILLKKGVPANDIIVAADIVTNSYDESIAVRNWAKGSGARRVIIPTDVFHTRRVRWLYGKELQGTGLRVEIDAVPVLEYSVTNWWQREQGVIGFENEVLKYAYYRLKY